MKMLSEKDQNSLVSNLSRILGAPGVLDVPAKQPGAVVVLKILTNAEESWIVRVRASLRIDERGKPECDVSLTCAPTPGSMKPSDAAAFAGTILLACGMSQAAQECLRDFCSKR